MNLLKFLPGERFSFGNDLAILRNFCEKAKEVSPLPALKQYRVLGITASRNLIVFDPAEVCSIQIAVSDLKFSPVLGRFTFLTGVGNCFSGNNLAKDFAPILEFRLHQPTRPEETQGIRGHNNDQGKNHDQTEG